MWLTILELFMNMITSTLSLIKMHLKKEFLKFWLRMLLIQHLKAIMAQYLHMDKLGRVKHSRSLEERRSMNKEVSFQGL